MLIGESNILAFALGGGAVLAALRAWWVRRDNNPRVCDLRRCIVIVGNSQNDPDCIKQRISLKPHLMMVRDANINVIEIYGNAPPRRNGKPLEWTDNKSLRKTLLTENGFCLMCIDDDGEIAMRVRLPVSEHVIAELIDGSVNEALPSPDNQTVADEPTSPEAKTKENEPANPTDSWSVGVLR